MMHRTLTRLTASIALLSPRLALAQVDESPKAVDSAPPTATAGTAATADTAATAGTAATSPEASAASTDAMASGAVKTDATQSPAATVSDKASEPPAGEAAAATKVPAADDGKIAVDIHGWNLRLYGFGALNVMHDSTQSFSIAAGNAMLQRVGTFRGDNDQFQFTARDSRLGLTIGAPDTGFFKASSTVEVDFGSTQPTEATESTTYINTPLRMRQFYVKVETPIVDAIAGQYYDVFGWGGKGFFPSTLAFLGVTGEVYHRQPQFRLSKTLSSDAVDFEAAAAAVRPVQKASGVPDVEAGLRLALNKWTGIGQQAYSQPGLSPLEVGVSGIGRRFEVAQFVEYPGTSNTVNGWGVAVDAFIPVIPAKSTDNRANALSLTGEFSDGHGISDMYNSDLTGGALFPALSNPQNRTNPSNPPPLYTANIDSGIVTYDGNGKLRPIDWLGYLVGIQYYLPIASGKVWVSGNYSHVKSSNIVKLTPIAGRSAIYSKAQYVDGNLFVALTRQLQVGYSFQLVEQTFGDGVKAHNYRNEGAIHYFF